MKGIYLIYSMKKIILTLLIIAIILALAFINAACQKNGLITLNEYFDNDGNSYDSISMSDITLPADIDLDELGLFWANDDGWVRYDSENVPFDENKPIVIFAHGMGTGDFAPNKNEWLSAGYNVGSFLWGEFADDDPYTGQSKVWGIQQGKMRWKRGNGEFETADIPSHSIAEIYAACYNDFMAAHDFCGSEIRLYGHSLGGQLTVAVSSYFVTALKSGKMNPNYLPDRISLLDPFFSNLSDSTKVNWLDTTLTDGASVKIALNTVKELKIIGIAVEYLRSSPWVEMAAYADANNNYNEELVKEVMHCDFDTRFLPLKYGIYDGIQACHILAEDWYGDAISVPIFNDSKEGVEDEFGIGPNTPTSYIYARMGNSYATDLNKTEDDFSDDVQQSLDIEKAKIAGFAFADDNKNGIMDDRIKCRVSGVAVSLYEKGNDKAIKTFTTDINGYYEFEIETLDKNYYIKAEAKSYTFINKFDADNSYMSNGVDESGLSEDIVLPNTASLRIINIGLVK